MSALSEQCEALRLWAKLLRECEPILASDLREAADTILNLRDMAQKAQSEKAALERRIDELCAEVERLRKAKDTMHGDAFEIGAMLVKARDENAKLREQVDYMTPLALYAASERERERMRKLGIEVPE